MLAVDVVLGVLGAGALWLATGVRVVQQFERGVGFRFGKVHKINVQIITMPVPAQEGITRDNVTVRVDAVVYFRVHDPVLASVNVQNYTFAMSQVAQTSLRSIIGKSELDDLLTNREPLN